jgi:hypothetical protein
MDQAVLESMVGGGAASSAQMLKQAPIDDLDEVVGMLKRYLSTEEIWRPDPADRKGARRGPQTLKEVYYYCA